jgi:hypothetical protein
MQKPLDNTPADGDFARYVETLSQRLMPAKLNVLSPGEQARGGDLMNSEANDLSTYDQLSATNTSANASSRASSIASMNTPVRASTFSAPKPLLQNINAATLSNPVKQVVADVFKKRNAEARLSTVDKLNAIKNSQRNEPFTEPRDKWEARWQPLFELVNQNRWLIIGAVFVVAITLDLLSTVFAQSFGVTLSTHTVLFDLFDMDSTELTAGAVISGGLSGYLLWRLYMLAQKASAQHEDSPALFWSLLVALALIEFVLSRSNSFGFSLLFWLALAFGGISGGLWRIVRGLHRAGMLFTNETLK